MTRRFSHPQTAPRGSVLVVVLWVSVGLVSLALVFGHAMLMNYRAADNDLAGRQAELAIEGAVRYAESILSEKKGELPAETGYESEAVPVGEAQFWFLGRSTSADAANTQRPYGLIDEGAKLNLNFATPQMLENLAGLTADEAASIVAWRTSEKATLVPAQSSTSTDAKFESVEELALVTGFDSTLLYGEDANLNGFPDANETDGDQSPPFDNSDGTLNPGLSEYVTVFTAPPKTRSDGGTRVKVSDRTEIQNNLQTALTELLSANDAQAVIGRLGTNTFQNVFAFYAAAQLTVEQIDKVADAVWSSGAELVNVNSASVTVLTQVLGNAQLAESLVAARASNAQPSTGIAWAYQILHPAGADDASRYLTGRSYQFTADVAAVGRFGRGYRRARCVIDVGGTEPRIIYRRNLASLGWALGPDVRQTLAQRTF